jgi:hypothetical protein
LNRFVFKLAAPILDDVGRVIAESPDTWEARAGVALSLNALCPSIPDPLALDYIRLIVPDALMDRNSHVRDAMRNAAVEGIRRFGEVSCF